MSKNIAISVKGVSKTFKIPYEKVSSIRGIIVNAFHRATYEEFKALDDVSFEVKKGEFFGIIGRNGSGKSTLLKILAHIYQPDKGSVKIDGMISPFLELGIGFNPELSGRDNVYLNATVLGLSKKQIDEKFDSIVAFSELERFIDQKLKNYSSGMQVRLAFSVSIHANRDILLMDEVLAVGDSNFQSKCLEEFNKYREMGRTVIIVTHDIGVVQRYCDRAMLLRNGKVKMIGKAEKVANEYIQENMGDEESRLTHDQQLTTNDAQGVISPATAGEKSKPQKVAEITKVEFLDKDGNKKNVFQTGEKMQIQVYYQIYQNLSNPIFGIIIKDAFNKIPLFVTNTQFLKVQTKEIKKGKKIIVYTLENYFGTGEYFVSPAIADESAKIFYDWRDDMEKFKVINKDYSSFGLVDIPHTINFL